MILSAAVLLLPLRTLAGVYAAQRANRHLAWGGLAIQTLFLAAVAWAAWSGTRVVALALAAYCTREILLSLLPLPGLRRLPAAAAPRAAGNLRGLELVAVATLFSAAYFHVDVFMLEALVDASAVSDYGLAARVLGPMVTCATLLFAPFIPFLGRDLGPGREPHGRDVLLAAFAVIGAMLPFVIVMQLSAPLVRLTVGEPRPVAAAALSELAWAVPAVILGTAFSASLVLARRYLAWAVITAAGLALNVVLNYLLIPDLGAAGAAHATVVTETFVGLAAIGVQARGQFEPPLVSRGVAVRLIVLALVPSLVATAIYLPLAPSRPVAGFLFAVVLAGAAAAAHTLGGAARALRRQFERGVDRVGVES